MSDKNNNIALSINDGNEILKLFIKKNEIFSAAKLGGSECVALECYNNGNNITKEVEDNLIYNSGLYPFNEINFVKFINLYLKSMNNISIFAEWFIDDKGNFRDRKILNEYSPVSLKVPLRTLEPFYFDEPWSEELKDKRVLVINPFAETIKKQFKIKEKIWKNKKILPDFELKTLRCSFSAGISKPEYDNWFKALDVYKKEILNIKPDFVIVGAGGWSLPLVSFCKINKISAVHMGGGVQILFGIKGSRWKNHPINKCFNEYWVFPSKEETPLDCHKLTGGDSFCYWEK